MEDIFFPAVKKLEDYLQKQNDVHAYYTQRCNEMVFLLNQQKIFEAYMKGRELSIELREKDLEKEMYMAYNLLGHINNICGNKIAAKRNFYRALDMMEQQGYYENMPPVYMNIVNVEMGDNPQEAIELLNKAQEIAEKYAPERVFDIETRRTISYYNAGDIPKFLEGYKAYKEGVKEGKSSVHGRTMEVYYLASQGEIDKAIDLAKKELGDDGEEIITLLYEKSGRWKEAYENLRIFDKIFDVLVPVTLRHGKAETDASLEGTAGHDLLFSSLGIGVFAGILEVGPGFSAGRASHLRFGDAIHFEVADGKDETVETFNFVKLGRRNGEFLLAELGHGEIESASFLLFELGGNASLLLEFFAHSLFHPAGEIVGIFRKVVSDIAAILDERLSVKNSHRSSRFSPRRVNILQAGLGTTEKHKCGSAKSESD